MGLADRVGFVAGFESRLVLDKPQPLQSGHGARLSEVIIIDDWPPPVHIHTGPFPRSGFQRTTSRYTEENQRVDCPGQLADRQLPANSVEKVDHGLRSTKVCV